MVDVAPYEVYALHGPDKLQYGYDNTWGRLATVTYGSSVEVPHGSKIALAHVIWDEVVRRFAD